MSAAAGTALAVGLPLAIGGFVGGGVVVAAAWWFKNRRRRAAALGAPSPSNDLFTDVAL